MSFNRSFFTAIVKLMDVLGGGTCAQWVTLTDAQISPTFYMIENVEQGRERSDWGHNIEAG